MHPWLIATGYHFPGTIFVAVLRTTVNIYLTIFLLCLYPQCIDINIPDGDDATLIFLPMSEDIDPDLEDWFVTEVGEITRPESKQFLKQDLPSLPADMNNQLKKYNTRSKISLTIEEDGQKPISSNHALRYFHPTIIRNIAQRSRGWHENRGNYRLCVSARGSGDIRVVFDTIKISEYKSKKDKKHLIHKDHLTPLEKAFEESANVAKTVIDEMHYMEKREQRMKKTADGTNARVRYFSYISIAILLGVTYIQITYLKGYFKKKKIL